MAGFPASTRPDVPEHRKEGFSTHATYMAHKRLESCRDALQTLKKGMDNAELQHIVNTVRYFADLAEQQLKDENEQHT